MLAGNYNFTIDQGAHFERVITITNSDDSIYDLTGFTARMQIRTEIDSSTVVRSLTTENGGITLGGDEGTITLVILAANTALMTSDGVYDIEIIDEEDRVFRILKGKIKLELEVTR